MFVMTEEPKRPTKTLSEAVKIRGQAREGERVSGCRADNPKLHGEILDQLGPGLT